MKLWHGRLKDSVYHASVDILVGPIDEARVWFTKHPEFPDTDPPDVWARMAGKTTHSDCGTWVVWLRPDIVVPSTIAHEAFHLTAQILGQCGLRLSDKSEEAYAYYLGSIVAQLTDATVRARRRR